MPPKIYLHDHPDFISLLKILAEEMGISPILVEKDYWITHALYGLQQLGLTFEMKGGTSLSKGYQIIDRFSEDIDLKIEPPQELEVKTGKNHMDVHHIASRDRFFNWLLEKIKIPGIIRVERERAYDDEKLRNAGIRLVYQTHFGSSPALKDGILLEVGFDDTTPNLPQTLSSWAFDRATKQQVDVIDNRAVNVACYVPEYTLVEKLQAISTKYRNQQEAGKFPTNFLRHYYDAYRLLHIKRVLDFIGTDEFQERKKKRFRKQDNLDLRTNEAFHLKDETTRKLYEQEFLKTKDLYIKGQPSFSEILLKIAEHMEKLSA